MTGQGADAPSATLQADIAKAARYTLLSMDQHRSIGQLALRYEHVPDPNSEHIAYATAKRCCYGPRFATMDRFSQTFVVGHETMHHVLGHIEHGAVLYKREGVRFSPIGFNIAADAIINFVLEQLPDVDKLGASIRYGVRKCQEFGIVSWDKLVAEVRDLARTEGLPVDPTFSLTPDKLSVVEIYHALMRLRRNHQDKQDGRPGEPGGQGEPGNEDILERIGRTLDAHEDLFDAIKKKSSDSSEGDLLDQISRGEDVLRQMQASAGRGDAILRVKRPDGLTKTPWPQAMRRMAANALLSRPTINYHKPARRVISQIARALDPRTADGPRVAIPFEPRVSLRMPAKKCVTILDTSGSVFSDKALVADCLREIGSICRRVNTTQIVIFADAEVCEIVPIEDSLDRIAALEPKGGGATDFRPAISAAEKLNPDLIVYLTDLCGTFPDRKPRCPIIWGYLPGYEDCPTPFGLRLPLHP